ncbi:G patch domain-containing protein 1 [Tremella mesenterica]|uniref:G patch domain-containing protein 1 n=1 Tax=Tremella mesenterica TaxID=5217 RepID=A0A4Q1BC23_TREME|nr:G patch domain-containing protein 1 [Tremella mesenterica]
MTSRLKHKLELENVNLNSAYLNESFVQIGTPLPALAETKKDKQEYLPVWQQEARDEKGRRRFHGAWTGGFTAGYGNTVGSKEGWKPSTFKSSRSNRATKVQRPEDFMDEEDLKEMNEDRRLENTDVFKDDGFRGTKEEVEGKSLPSVLESMIAPARTSIGQTLLQKLGWRPGQGIGPRVSLRKLKLQEARLGGKGVVNEEDEEMDETENSKHTYAPRDVRLVTYDSKDDRAGLGFEKGRGMGRLTGKIGPGDDPDEEDDPYAEAGPSTRPHLVFEPDEEDEVIVMGGPVPKSSGTLSEKPQGNDKHHWHDGRPVLPNFELDPLSVPTDKWFEFPKIPPDWRPRPARVWGTTRKWDELPGTKPEEKDTIRGVPGRPLTFEQRGEALGEEQHLSKARSVGEYMYEKENERLSSLKSTINQPPPPPLSLSTIELEEITNPQRPTSVEIPPLSPRTASAALRGYIPYGDDLIRQERYRSYLISQTYNTTQADPILRIGSVDEINKELEDFASSARIFKPLSHAMSSRFTSGSTSLAANDMKEIKPGLHMYDATKVKLDLDSQQPSYEEVLENKILTPREQAAQNGMYGTLTRVVKDFYPVKLLCKRFGVPDPHPEGEPKNIVLDNERSEDLPKNDANWEKAFVHQSIPSQFGKPDSTTGGKDEKNEEGEERVPRNLGEVGMAEDMNQGRDTLNYTKPTIDIFKAIFASDDESEDEEEDDRQGVSHPTNLELKVGKEVNVKEEKFEDPSPVKEKMVDINNFKPVFNKKDKNIFGGGKEGNGNSEKKVGDQDEGEDRIDGLDKEEKKEEKEKKKKKRKGVLSFDVGEEEIGFKKKKLTREKSSLDSTFQHTERQDEFMIVKRESENGVESLLKRSNGQDGRDEINGREGIDDVKGLMIRDNEDEGEWVEKPNVVPRSIGRKGAADFM